MIENVETAVLTHRSLELAAKMRKAQRIGAVLFNLRYDTSLLKRLRLHEWQLVAKVCSEELGERVHPPSSLEMIDMIIGVVSEHEAKHSAPRLLIPQLENWGGFPCLNTSIHAVYPSWRPPSEYLNKLMRIWKLACADVFRFCRKAHPVNVRYGFLYDADNTRLSMFRENCLLVSGWVLSEPGSAGSRVWKKRFPRGFRNQTGKNGESLRNMLHEAALVAASNVLSETFDEWLEEI